MDDGQLRSGVAMRRPRGLFVLVVGTTIAATLAPSPAAGQTEPVYVIDQAQVARTIAIVEAATGQDVLSGELSGAAWIAQIPANWNGDLVIYAHGYRGEVTSLTVDPPPQYQYLTANGYAWAASSYRRNSYDPGIGVVDTRLLTRQMQQTLRRRGALDETYLVGVSMGGHVTAAAIERYPTQWDGALSACGVVGDVELFDYFLDYNVGAAAIAGLAPDFLYPDPSWLTTTVPRIKAALSTNPTGLWAGGPLQIAGAPSPLTPAGEAFKNFVEIGSGGNRVTYDVAWYYWHGVVPSNGPGNFFFNLAQGDGTIANRPGIVAQNTDMTYAQEYGIDIDDEVVRVEAAPSARTGIAGQPSPVIEGTPSIPVLTIHTTGDLFVPIEMEQHYARDVAAHGRSNLLVQRAIRDVGHCTFNAGEYIAAYTDLFAWVEDGVKPAGEDLIGGISSPRLGCAFTIGTTSSTQLRARLEACPP
jgi:pimeloyl-ACP methyl ester carboxylesterase